MTTAKTKATLSAAIVASALSVSVIIPTQVDAYVSGCTTGNSSLGWYATCSFSSSGKVRAKVLCQNIITGNSYDKYGPSVSTGQASVITGCGALERVYNNAVYAVEG
ncbi:MAG: hypothetical protein LBH36_03080 [Candidatus Nomurabacteria bacterium]|jgi:hypothetical protein|nr:hypothetical protein [Candidatus Nomurabacteria bacterium]